MVRGKRLENTIGPSASPTILSPLTPIINLRGHEYSADEGVDGYVCQDDERQQEVALPKGVVDAADEEEEREDAGQRDVHGESGVHHDVVDVGLVWLEDAVACEPSLDGYPHDVEDGDEQQRDGDEHLLVAAIHWGYGTHEALDAHVGADVAEEEAASIAHEYLAPSDFPEDVEAPEDHQRAYDSCIERGDGGVLAEQHHVGQQDENAESRRKAVDAVYEVDGVYNGVCLYHSCGFAILESRF